MKIMLENDTSRHEIDIAVTHALDDLAVRIRDVYGVSKSPYLFDFGEKTYSYQGDMDTAVYQCDLFLYTDTPALFYSRDLTVWVSHENVSDTVYDYCDFEHPHYCLVFEETIDIDSCYTFMMCLNGFFTVESSERLMAVTDLDRARERCKRCIYTNCDGIHHEQTLKGLSLASIQPSQKKYRVHLTGSSPGGIDGARAAFLERFPKSDDREE